MDIISKIAKKFNLTKEATNRTEEILKQRDEAKLSLAVKLYQGGFSDDEIEEVLDVIKRAENDIEKIKNSLIGTNINPDESKDLNQPLIDGIDLIKKRQQEMQLEIKETIDIIVKRHQPK